MSNWINNGRPVEQGENAEIPWTITFPWATSLGTPAVAVYKDGTTTDVAGTVMPSGSHSTSGNQLTMKVLKLLTGGETYIISITVAVDSITDEWFMEVDALKSETGKAT